MRLDDPRLVRDEYADERGLSTRIALYGRAKRGGDARDAVFAAVAEANPQRVLEVGCGQGELAERIQCELGADVAAIDSSPRMVELTRRRGIDAELADAVALPFADGLFDCAVAAWVLYHVRDLDRVVAELHRVLRPGGRLVAATNGIRHLEEMWRLVGLDKPSAKTTFHGGNGSEILGRMFPSVETRKVEGHVVFGDRAAVVDYINASIIYKHLAERVPALNEPLRARASATIFVGHKAAS